MEFVAVFQNEVYTSSNDTLIFLGSHILVPDMNFMGIFQNLLYIWSTATESSQLMRFISFCFCNW